MDAAPTSEQHRLVGRAAEVALVDRLLDAPEGAPGLLIEGPPGIGVSALVGVAAAHAEARGMTVVRGEGVEAEAGFPYAGLQQLLPPLMGHAGALTRAQRGALNGALDAGEAERAQVGLAAAALVAAAAREVALAICVDDAQWLDDDTCAVLAALARRSAHDRCAMVAGSHDGRRLADAGCEHLRLGPLPDADAAALLDAREPLLPTFVRARVLHHAAGLPLAIAELPSAYRDASDGTLLAPVPPLTPRLQEAFAPELDAMAPAELAALLPTALSGVARAGADLHPLAAAALIERASPAALQAAHLALAEAEPERAPWHRAAATPGTDPAVAAELEAAAARTIEAGDHVHGAAGLRTAARLTPAGPERSRRAVAAADALHEVGAWHAGLRLLDDVDPGGLDIRVRAQLVAVRRRIEPRGQTDGPGEQLVGLAREAAAVGDRAMAMRLLWRAAAELQALGDGADGGDDVVAAAEELAGDAEEPVRLSVLAALRTREREAEILAGVAARLDGATSPLDLALLGHAAVLAGDGALALRAFDRAEPLLRSAGRLTLLGQVLTLAAWAGTFTGDLHRTRAVGAEAARLTADNGLEVWAALGRTATAMAAGLAGDEERCEADAAAAERVALPAGASAVLVLVQHARGLTALSAGRPREAFEHLARAFDPRDPCHDRISTPAMIGDLAEAAGSDEERAFAARCLAACPTGTAPRLRVAVAHAALVLADDADADAAFAAARRRAAGCGPVDEGRMLLVHGMRLRRGRRVAESRVPLRRAAELLDGAGSFACAERARRELAATAEHTHRGSGDEDRLTPQELQIAQLVARGRSNREIAAELALSPRTVGHHLTQIYRKLGVPSRAGVASALARGS